MGNALIQDLALRQNQSGAYVLLSWKVSDEPESCGVVLVGDVVENRR